VVGFFPHGAVVGWLVNGVVVVRPTLTYLQFTKTSNFEFMFMLNAGLQPYVKSVLQIQISRDRLSQKLENRNPLKTES
jgi:hypothetical protein